MHEAPDASSAFVRAEPQEGGFLPDFAHGNGVQNGLETAPDTRLRLRRKV
jgi:hypothetical protein